MLSITPLSCTGALKGVTCTAHGCCSKAGTDAALQRQGRAAGSRQEEKRLTQGVALRDDLIDTYLFPREKVTEISAPWGWYWDISSLGLPVPVGNWGGQHMRVTGLFSLCSTVPGRGISSHGWNGILLKKSKSLSSIFMGIFDSN